MQWTEEFHRAFNDIKQAQVGLDVVDFPTDDRDFILDTYASDETIGMVLTQNQTGVEWVIAYGSQILGKPEWNYCVTNRELLAVKYFAECYKHYLLN